MLECTCYQSTLISDFFFVLMRNCNLDFYYLLLCLSTGVLIYFDTQNGSANKLGSHDTFLYSI